MLSVKKLLQQVFFTLLFFANQLTTRHQVFSIFKHVLSWVSNLTNIMNWDMNKQTGLYAVNVVKTEVL